jgi:hypothetical protein
MTMIGLREDAGSAGLSKSGTTARSVISMSMGSRFVTSQDGPPFVLAVCSLGQYNTGEPNRSKIRFGPQKLGSGVVAQDAANGRNGFCRQGYESGILQGGD